MRGCHHSDRMAHSHTPAFDSSFILSRPSRPLPKGAGVDQVDAWTEIHCHGATHSSSVGLPGDNRVGPKERNDGAPGLAP